VYIIYPYNKLYSRNILRMSLGRKASFGCFLESVLYELYIIYKDTYIVTIHYKIY